MLVFMVFLIVLFVFVVMMPLIFRKEWNPSANVFTIHGPTTMIENEIRTENDQHAITGLQCFPRRIAIKNAVDIAVLGFVNEFAVLVVNLARTSAPAFNHPHIEYAAANSGCSHGPRKADF